MPLSGIPPAPILHSCRSEHLPVFNNSKMDKHPTLGNGKICYVEIPAFDDNISSVFYEKVFGWNIRHRQDGHLSFDDSVNEVSGAWVSGRNPSTAAGLLIYIMVDSVEETIEKIVAAFREKVSFNGEDRVLRDDMVKAVEFLSSYELSSQVAN